MKRDHIFTTPYFLIAVLVLALPHADMAWSSGMRSMDSSSDSFYNDSSIDSYDSWHSGDITEADCRFCHENIERFTLLKETNPDKHHLLVDSLIESPVIAPYGLEGELYVCASCHPITWSDSQAGFSMEVIRDCLFCHPEDTVTGNRRSNNVHHRTETFYQNRCSFCHSNWSN